MKRTTPFVSAVTLGLASLVLAPSPALAQIGPWSQQHPAWVDLNRNGQIDAGEVGMYPEAHFDPAQPTTSLDALYITLANNPWDSCPGFVETRINAIPLLNPTQIIRRHGVLTDTVNLTGAAPPYTFDFTETKFIPPPARPGRPRPLDQTVATGTAQFLDPDADGVYDQFQTSTSGPIPFVFKDTSGDGKPDWVSFPWALTGALGVKQTGGCLGGTNPDPQVWLPLNDTNGNGIPVTVDVVFPDPSPGGGNGGLHGIPIVPPAIALANYSIPTLGGWGLIGLSAALALAGARLLRGASPGPV